MRSCTSNRAAFNSAITRQAWSNSDSSSCKKVLASALSSKPIGRTGFCPYKRKKTGNIKWTLDEPYYMQNKCTEGSHPNPCDLDWHTWTALPSKYDSSILPDRLFAGDSGSSLVICVEFFITPCVSSARKHFPRSVQSRWSARVPHAATQFGSRKNRLHRTLFQSEVLWAPPIFSNSHCGFLRLEMVQVGPSLLSEMAFPL